MCIQVGSKRLLDELTMPGAGCGPSAKLAQAARGTVIPNCMSCHLIGLPPQQARPCLENLLCEAQQGRAAATGSAAVAWLTHLPETVT